MASLELQVERLNALYKRDGLSIIIGS